MSKPEYKQDNYRFKWYSSEKTDGINHSPDENPGPPLLFVQLIGIFKEMTIILDARNIAAGTIIMVVVVIINGYCARVKNRVDREQIITEYTKNIFCRFLNVVQL